jgi:TolB-like protein/tetratricopeptide (TPR) repeat protein
MSFFGELKRRNVVRVGIAYVVIGWVLAQVAEFVVENFGAPDWVLKTFVVFLFLGLPLALFFAWAFEITPEGVKREKDVDRSQSITTQTGRKLDFIIIGVLVVAVGFLLVDKLYLSERAADVVEIVATESLSIAVLPFANMSDDSDHFADGLSEELLNLLTKVPDLKVSGRTSSWVFKNHSQDLREIGEILGVNHVLEGSVRRSGSRLRVTAQLIKVEDGFHIWSETYNREMADIFDIQDDVASAITSELKLRLAPSASRPTDNVDAYAIYLEALAMLNLQTAGTFEIAAQLDRALLLDPKFAKAHELKAVAYWEMPGSPETQQLIYGSAQAALEIDPALIIARAYSIGADPGVWSWSIEFDAMGSAADAIPDNYSLRAAMCYNLLMTGYREEALHCGRRLIQLEPLAPLGYWRTGLALSALGRREEARASFQRAIDFSQLFRAWDIALDYLIAKEFESAIEILEKAPAMAFWNPKDARHVVENAADPVNGKAFLDEWIDDVVENASDFLDVNRAYYWYLAFGHIDDYWQQIENYEAQTDSAWTMADELEIWGTAFPASGYTRHPQYLTNGIIWGLTELWDTRGPPDMCSKSTGQWVCE